MQYTKSYKHDLRICNNFSLSTEKLNAKAPQYCVIRTFHLLFNIFRVLQGNVLKKFTWLCNCVICHFILDGSLGIFIYVHVYVLEAEMAREEGLYTEECKSRVYTALSVIGVVCVCVCVCFAQKECVLLFPCSYSVLLFSCLSPSISEHGQLWNF
jgi:hypothetical protein